MIERTLIILKPDAMRRGITGEILQRFERAGLKIIGSKMVRADKETVMKHYQKDEKWHEKVGSINIKDCEKYSLNVQDVFGTKDAVKIGQQVNEWLFNILDSSPVLVFVLQGPHAVEIVRKLVGETIPSISPPGTIRGDFGLDSPLAALQRKSAIYNLLHASGEVDEAEMEINLWFNSEELFDYSTSNDDLYSYPQA